MSDKDLFEEKSEPKGFIGDYANEILSHQPTSPDWAESIATAVFATAIGDNTRFYTKIGPLKLNVWFLVIGPSGLAYKSVPLLYYVYPTLSQLSEAIEKPVIMPGRFSIEGMIEYMSGHYRFAMEVEGQKETKMRKKALWVPPRDEGIIVRDEFTSLFKEVTNKSYVADEMEFLSELYDGALQKRFTRKTQLEEAKDVCVSFLSATTPYLFTVWDPTFFIQGLGNRFLYVWFEPEEPKKEDAVEFFLSPVDVDEREKVCGSYARRLAEMRKAVNGIYVGPVDDAAELMTKYKFEKDKTAKQEYDRNFTGLDYSYITRLPTFVYKLSALHCLSRNEQALVNRKLSEILVREQDVEWAINKVETHLKHFETIRKRWGTVSKSKEVVTSKDEHEYMLNLIRLKGGKVKHTTLFRDTNFSTPKFNEIISGLVARGDVKVEKEEGVARRPAIYYVLVS